MVLCVWWLGFTEFHRFAPSIKVIVYHGNRPTRHGIWTNQVQKGEFHVLLTTYDFIINKKDTPKLGSVPWEYICVDEGHRMKNTESRLTTTLSTRYTSKHRIILTGTPLQNSLRELWSLPLTPHSAPQPHSPRSCTPQLSSPDLLASRSPSASCRSLLNFLLPTIFNSSDNFEDWYDAHALHTPLHRAALQTCTSPTLTSTLCCAVLRCVGSTSRSRVRAWTARTWTRRRSC